MRIAFTTATANLPMNMDQGTQVAYDPKTDELIIFTKEEEVGEVMDDAKVIFYAGRDNRLWVSDNYALMGERCTEVCDLLKSVNPRWGGQVVTGGYACLKDGVLEDRASFNGIEGTVAAIYTGDGQQEVLILTGSKDRRPVNVIVWRANEKKAA